MPKNNKSAIVIDYINNPAMIYPILQSGSSEEIYYALWAVALQDQKKAVNLIDDVLKSDDVEKRLSAVRVLVRLNVKEVIPTVINCLDDENLEIPKTIFSNDYFAKYLKCHHDLLVQSNLYDKAKMLREKHSVITWHKSPGFFRHIGETSNNLTFLGFIDFDNLNDFVKNLAERTIRIDKQ